MTRITIITLATAVALTAACDTGGEAETELELDDPTLEQELGSDTAATGTMASAATLAVDSLESSGPYLTDGSGRALYLIEGAPQDSATCYDACAEEWPPFLAPQGQPGAAAQPVDSTLIGTIQRRDGRTQVTYAGHALYYYRDDTGAGQTTGQDVTDQWGEWYLVRPDGEPLH